MDKLNLKSLLIIVVVLLIGIVALFRIQQRGKSVMAGWFNDAWQYRKAITLTNSGTGQTNVYVTISIGTSDTARFQADAGDIRFVDQKSKNLNYFLVSGVGTSGTVIHVKFDVYPAGSSTFYLYYGNSSAPNGFSSADFTTAASNSSTNLLSEERSPAPIAYWSFDEGVGTSAFDSSSNRHNGTINGASWQTEDMCVSGKCLKFDGSNDVVYAGTGNNYFPLPIFSMCAWIKTPGLGISQVDPGIITLTYGLRFDLNSSGQFFTSMDSGTADQTVTVPDNLFDNKFHYLCLTYDGTNRHMYIDGLKKISIGTTWLGTTRWPASSFAIGRDINNSNEYFNGYIDEPKIYAYARTATQIKQDYAVGKAKVGGKGAGVAVGKDNTDVGTSPPLIYYNFEEGIGTTTYDKSGNQNNCVLLASPTWSIGKFGKAILLNGSSQRCTKTSGIGTSQITIEAWLYRTSATQNQGIVRQPPAFAISLYNNTIQVAPGNSWTFYNTGITIPQNSWQHVAWTYDSSIMKVFLNGQIGWTTALAGTLPTNTNDLYIGYDNNNWWWGGKLDELKIYNYARTQQQILQDMNAGNPMSQKTPILWYKMDEGKGTITNNWGVGGTGYKSTFGTGNSAPNWTTGKVNQGLNFDGNDYSTTTFTALGQDKPFTMSTWFKTSTSLAYQPGILSLGYYPVITMRTDGTIQAWWYGGVNYPSVTSLRSYNDGKFHYVGLTYDGITVKLYIDGIFETSTVSSVYSVHDGFFIGVEHNNGNKCFNGIIDEVKLYNYALTSDEIKLDYNQGAQFVMGKSNQTIGGTTTSLDYCIPGDTTACSPPIAEYKFEEGTGTTAFDTSGNNNNGTLINSPSWTIGKIGKSLSFGTTASYVNIPTISPAITGQQITISGWFNINSLSGIQRLISISNTSPSFGLSGNYLYVHTATSTGSDVNLPYFVLPTNCQTGWHYLSLTWNTALAADNVNVYCDGRNVSKGTLINSINGNITLNSLWLGHSTQSFSGKIDQVRIYNYARTPAQIAYDYNGGKPVGWWKFDECEGTMINDWSGIGNTGTLVIGAGGSQVSVGTCSIGDTSAWANGNIGKINSAMYFDGVDDYVRLSTSKLMGAGGVSFVAWIKPTMSKSYNYFLGKGNMSSGNPATKVLGIGLASNYLSLYISQGDGSGWCSQYGNVLISLNTWSHVVGTFDKTTQAVRLYVNGVQKYQTSCNQTGDSEGSDTLFIGDDSTVWWPNGFFNGYIDDARVYNYTLTSEQIKQVYNGGAINFR